MTYANIAPSALNNEQMMQILGAVDLEAVNGGFSFGGLWDDVKSVASDVATMVENHPIATLAFVAAAVTGVGAVGDALALGGTVEAAYMGESTGSLLVGAGAKTAAAAFSGMVVGGIGTGIYDAIKHA